MNAHLLQRWRTLAGEDDDAVGRALIAAYAQPQRRYHDQGHLTWLLDEADRRAKSGAGGAFVRYAIWFHDAVYEPGEPDNEARSADWARAALRDDPALAERTARVIEMTAHHERGEASGEEALFLDMDIAILGEPWEAYCRYAAGIRAEYPLYNDEAFAAGRARFLDQQLQRPRIFRVDLYENERGGAARANMSWELEEMRRGRMVKA